MKARYCVAILALCVVHPGDVGPGAAGGGPLAETVPASVQRAALVDDEFATRRFVQRAVWVNGAKDFAALPGGDCVETLTVCTDCAQSVTAIDGLDRCDRPQARIAF